MATSGTTAYTQTARQALTTALELVQSCMIGQTPNALNAETARTHANLMLKTWGIDPRLWIMTEGSVPLVAGTASYVLTAARRVTSVRRRTSNIDTPLIEMSRSEYYDYPSKSASGMPFQYYFDPQRSIRTLYVINVPGTSEAASTTLQYTYQRVIEDVATLDENLDIPQEWQETFDYCLAARLLVPFTRFVSDPATSAKIEERAGTLFAQLTADSQESASVFFSPS
jgi:hypothetical protein